MAVICNPAKESGVRGGGGGNKAMVCSRRRVLACIVCASDCRNALDTLSCNHAHNNLIEGPDCAHSLDANIARPINSR